uniref:Reverse transcriptase domain-containing protein n=1 Tax=Octopus bimaculoides TaxID=37653 RepID=A0A0L8G2I4_OCTBM
MVVDWIRKQATAGKKTGIQWTFDKQLEDLCYADDITFLSHKQQCVAEEVEWTGHQINIKKTEAMGEDIKDVDRVDEIRTN